MAALDAVQVRTGGTFALRELLGNSLTGELALVRARFGATRDGRDPEWIRDLVYRFNGERIAEIIVYGEDLEAVQAMLGDTPAAP